MRESYIAKTVSKNKDLAKEKKKKMRENQLKDFFRAPALHDHTPRQVKEAVTRRSVPLFRIPASLAGESLVCGRDAASGLLLGETIGHRGNVPQQRAETEKNTSGNFLAAGDNGRFLPTITGAVLLPCPVVCFS